MYGDLDICHVGLHMLARKQAVEVGARMKPFEFETKYCGQQHEGRTWRGLPVSVFW
jgi:hypothetical protein